MGLISDIQQDLDASAAQLIVEYRDRLFAEAVRLCNDVSSAEDLVCSTIEKAIRNIKSHRRDESLFGWMKTIMLNLRRDEMRSAVRRGTTPVDPSVLAETAEADWSSDEELLRRSDSAALREAIDRLDPEYKKAMVLHYFSELPVKQIATLLNAPVGTILWRLNIARKILARDLGQKLGKKPVVILLALLLAAGSLFGAWQAGLLDPLIHQSGEVQSGEAESFPLQEESTSNSTQSQSQTQHQPQPTMSVQDKEEPKVNSIKKTATLAATAAIATSALGAMANVIYVAPDGAGSGASWVDPAPITTAIATAVEAEGGEVWLKEGWYDLTAAIPLSTNVVVRGGFAGTETSADEADPKAHRTVLSAIVDASRYSWTSNSTRTVNCPLWKDGEFNLCLPTDEAGCIWRVPSIITGLNGAQTSATGFANIFTVPAGSTDVKISGVVFTGSRSVAIVLSDSSIAEVENCRFLACGVGSMSGGGISTTGLVRVKDCDFIGCGGAPLTLGGTDTTVSHKVINCLFYSNSGCSSTSRSAAIDVPNKTPVEIEGCTFRGNIGLARCASSIAGSVLVNANGAAMTIKNCLFEDNRCRTGTPTGTEAGNMPFGCIHAKGTVTIENCLFKGNNVKGENLDYAQGRTACICANGNLIVRNTVFAGNWISATTAKATTWSIVTCGSSSTGRFINCAFYDNEVCAEGTTEAATNGIWSTTLGLERLQNGSDTSYGVTILNCLFSNNKLASSVAIPETGTPRQAEVLLLDDNYKERPGFTYSLINTVIWNKSADHRSFREHPEINPWITHCDFVNCGDVAARTNGTTCIEYLTADDPGISPKVCRKRGTYPFKGMLGLALDSPFVKSGTPVYEKDGTFYIYEPGVGTARAWRHCTLKATSYASLTAGATPVADGFGAAREEDAFSYGPVVNVPLGLAVILK